MISINQDALRIAARTATSEKLSKLVRKASLRLESLGVAPGEPFPPLAKEEPHEATFNELSIADWIDSVDRQDHPHIEILRQFVATVSPRFTA